MFDLWVAMTARYRGCTVCVVRSTATTIQATIVFVLCLMFSEVISAASIDLQINAGLDDVEESDSGKISTRSSDMELVFDRGSNQTVGLRFNGVPIDQGTVIYNAYIQFTSDESTSVATNLLITGDASDHANAFSKTTFNVSLRTQTNANVNWIPNSWTINSNAGADQQTPDLTPIIQEIINRPGWNANNSIVLIISGTGERVAESFDGVPTSAAILHIEFDGPTANLAPETDAGTDATINLPANTHLLDANVSDDGLPDGTLITTWSHVGGSGTGSVVFADADAIDTTVMFTADPGSYTLRLTADDGLSTSFDEVIITLNPEGLSSLSFQIATGNDDAEERGDGSISFKSSDLELVNDRGGNQTVGMRFTDIIIEPGTTIVSAYLQFTVDETSSVPTNLTINGRASTNAPTFSNTTFSLSTLPRTAADVAWSPVAWTTVGQTGPDQKTPNLATIIQEIINQPGWSAGNSLALLIAGSGERIAESYNGVAASAAVLQIDFSGTAANIAPMVSAGTNTLLVLPDNTVSLDGTSTDDGLPSGILNASWSHVGGTGVGIVTFANNSAEDTTATFTPDTGAYVLRLTVNDGELTSFDDLTVTVSASGAIDTIVQTAFFRTGFSNSGSQYPVPSIDPAGIVYHGPSGRLIISDSEINEVPEAFNIIGANLFQTTLNGNTLLDQANLTIATGSVSARNREPTGITYCSTDEHFYVTNDDRNLVYRYQFDGSNFTAVDSVDTSPVTGDPEGITCDPISGKLYVIGGNGINIIVYRYDASGFVLEAVLDLVTTAGDPTGIPSDPEGIAIDPLSGHLFVLSDPDWAIFEYTTSGVYIKRYDLQNFSPPFISPQGLAIGTSSSDPSKLSFYISDAGVDNDHDPSERDGFIYEALIQRVE